MSSRILFDLLPTIFQFTLPPDYISLDTSIIKGPDSTWCRVQSTKISIILVSREWHQAGVALLYRDVVIRDFMQLLYFLRTLTTSETVNNPGRYVKSVFISCPVPQSVGSRFDALVQGIYKYCSGIAALTLSGPISSITEWVSPALLLQSFPPFITHLRIDQTPTYSMFIHMLNIIGPSLISLQFLFELYPDPVIAFDLPAMSMGQRITLPVLRSLFVGTYQPAHLPQDFLPLVARWNLPSLESLTISDASHGLSTEAVLPILSAHGPQLKYLHVEGDENVFSCLKLCPRLKRLVTDSWLMLNRRNLLSLTHNELEYVDIWHPQSSAIQPYGFQGYRPQEIVTTDTSWTVSELFPCFRGVRHIWYLPTYMLPDIEHFDPTWVEADEDRFEITIFESKLRHEVDHLIWDGVLVQEMVDDADAELVSEIAQADGWGSDSSSEWEPSDEESGSLTSYITEQAPRIDERNSAASSERDYEDLSDSARSVIDDYDHGYRSAPVQFDFMDEVDALLQRLSD